MGAGRSVVGHGWHWRRGKGGSARRAEARTDPRPGPDIMSDPAERSKSEPF